MRDSIDAVKRGREKGDDEMEISSVWSRYAPGEFDWSEFDFEFFKKLFHEELIKNDPNYLKSRKREWSSEIINTLEPNEYLDISTGKIVNLENRPERPTNEIWIPSLKVVGTEEDILRYFLKLNVNENQLRPHLAAKLP